MGDKNTIVFIDCETNGFDGEIVLTMALELDLVSNFENWYNLNSTAYYQDLQEVCENAFAVVMHNGCGFDEHKLLEYMDFTNIDILDTLILSRMLFPERQSHSLAAWGQDLKFPKGDFDWDSWDGTVTSDLVKYCKQDVEVTRRVFFECQNKMNETGGNWRKPHDFEYKCQQSVDQQAPFVLKPAQIGLVRENLVARMEIIRSTVYPSLPMVPVPKSKIRQPPKNQFKQDGTPSAHALKYFPTLRKAGPDYVFDHPDGTVRSIPWSDPINTHERVTFDSTGALKTWLMDQGWTPTYWNFKDGVRKGPRFQDDQRNLDPALLNLMKTKGYTWLKDLQEYLTLRHRVTTIEGWVKRSDLTVDPISGETVLHLDTPAVACGARTSRMTHKSVANVPRVSSAYGGELRGLLGVPEGYKLVGWDASALEACMEAHEVWAIDPEYAKKLVDGTLHDNNAKILGVDRDTAKTFKYAIMYGAGKEKLAKVLGCSTFDAAVLMDQYWHNASGLLVMKNEYERQFEKFGYIEGIDGRKLFPASKHTCLNTRLQSSGAIVMKTAMLLTEDHVRKKGLAFMARRVIAYHDEEQYRVQDSNIQHTFVNGNPVKTLPEYIGNVGVDSITQAGKLLGIHPELTGEYKIGSNWAETH